MKNILIAFIAVLALSVCNCKKEPNKGVVIEAYIDIAYKDSRGNDLLNPSTQNYFSASDIHLYNLVNGIKKEVYYPNYDIPHNFEVFKVDSLNQYFLKVFFETDTTLLQLNQSITDTLVCTFDRSNGNWLIRKFWYNGVLKWDREDGGEYGGYQKITIVK